MEKKPEVTKAILIDERRIELYWNMQVRRADEEKQFEVRKNGEKLKLCHWKEDEDWDYGTVYQKEHERTTICLEEPVDTAEAETIHVLPGSTIESLYDTSVEEGAEYTLKYEPYYTQFLKSNSGIQIKAGRSVGPATLKKAASILDTMLVKIPEIAKILAEKGAEVAIYGLLENAYDIPEHRMGYLLASRPVEGFGGTLDAPVSSISEANVIRLRSGRYATRYPHEMVLVHEYGHAIHLVGMKALPDQALSKQVMKTYQHAKKTGLWHDTYAISNYEEYFATMSTIWFNVMQEGVDGKWDGIRGPVNTREELKAYDPEAWKLMSQIYPDTVLPSPWDKNVNYYDLDGKPLSPDFEPYDLHSEKFEWQFIH